jgi:hypothetical protein
MATATDRIAELERTVAEQASQIALLQQIVRAGYAATMPQRGGVVDVVDVCQRAERFRLLVQDLERDMGHVK